MSLDWDMTKVKDFEKLHEPEDQRAITDMLVWAGWISKE